MLKNNKNIINQKEIVLIKVPYTDYSKLKIRPALVISNNRYNIRNKDILICAISSKLKNNFWHIKITNENLINENLKINDCIIKVDTIHLTSKNNIIKKIDIIKDDIFKKIKQKIHKIL